MATDLSTLVPSLRREIAPPGRFPELFPQATSNELAEYLLDGFAQAQLDGFLTANNVTDDGAVTPDLSRAAQALVVVWSGARILTVELMNRKSHLRYEASGAVYEVDQGTQLLVQALKDLTAKKQRLLDTLGRTPTDVLVVDGYFVKATGFYATEVAGSVGSTNPYGG